MAPTAKFEVKVPISIDCMAVIIVDAGSKDDAVEKAGELFAESAHSAIETNSMGWKATVTLKPPPQHLAALKRTDIKGQYVQSMSGATAKRQKD